MTIDKKGILEFNLDEPFSAEAFRRAVHADDCYRVFWEMNDFFRALNRENGVENSHPVLYKAIQDQDFDEAFDYIRSYMFQLMEQFGVTFDDYT